MSDIILEFSQSAQIDIPIIQQPFSIELPIAMGVKGDPGNIYSGKSITPSSVPDGTGVMSWTATQAGTYTNFGGLIVGSNEFAIISRDAYGAFSISKTLLDFSNKADLQVGKNKYNYLTDTPSVGFFINTIGNSVANAAYTASGFIPVDPSFAYISNKSAYNGTSYYAFYTANKTFISSSNVIGTVAPANTAYLRVSFNTVGSLSGVQIETGSSITLFENYRKTVPANQLNLDAITNQLAISATLVPGQNMFNKDAATIGKYISNTSSNEVVNATYDHSTYIPVVSGQQYSCNTSIRFVAYYDVNKSFVTGGTQFVTTFTPPAGVAYAIITITHTALNTCSLVLGATPKSYTKYKDVISPNNLEIFSSQIIQDGNAYSDTFKLFMPKEVCIADGRTIELYNNQISWCGNIDDYHFLWSGVGKSMKRKWSCTGNSSNIGTYTLTCKVFDNNNYLITQGSTTVRISAATFPTQFSLTTIGDSLTNSKAWQNEIVSLSGSQIKLRGTRGNVTTGNIRTHEGRSGATGGYYLGNSSYTFDSNGMVGNDGRTQDLNPFWNPSTSDVDFAYYKSNYNQNPDKLLIWLGTNGIAIDPAANAANIKLFIDKIRLTGGSTIPIFVVHTLFRGNQDGIGVQTGNDGYVANSTYKLEEDLKVFNLQEKILADLGAYSNLYLVPVSTCHDSEYNFGAVSTPVNPRASQVEFLPSEATHPQNQGYLQIADVIFSSLAVNQ